jgi:3-oxoacyl-[acyl-carrier-protein] synthase III
MSATEPRSAPASQAAGAPPARAHRTFLSHIAYSVGAAQPIETLQGQLSTAELESFRQRGLRSYRDDPRSVPQMCVASALGTLRDAGLDPGDVDSLLLVSSNADALVEDDDETALFAALHEAGFERARIIGLTLQACSACGDALRVAGGLVRGGGASRPVLVVVFGQKRTDRLGPQANLVFSDGAASCVVSGERGTFEVCASESITNTQLGSMGRAGSIAQFHGGMIELRDVARRVSEDAGVRLDDVRALLGTNAGVGHLHLMAQAAGVPIEKVYEGDVEDYSHLHSCDNLISLKHYSERYRLAAGDVFLLLSWSPHVFSASVLRCCASRRDEDP